ncbi:MAG: hypothetical protein PHW96_03005 [Candidatus Nanoarchaeia archaeon]|nr:hypothetical protein [Candidatus Nanoarchaeia archaeon]
MPIVEKVGKKKIKHKGHFSMSTVYNMAYDILISMGYTVKEKKYKQVEGESKRLEIVWEATKKVDDFTLFTLSIRYFLTTWMPKQKIQKEGATITADFGDPEITVGYVLTRDYEGKWDRNPFLSLFLNFYKKYIYEKTYKNWQNKIVEEAGEFVSEHKRYFEMA